MESYMYSKRNMTIRVKSIWEFLCALAIYFSFKPYFIWSTYILGGNTDVTVLRIHLLAAVMLLLTGSHNIIKYGKYFIITFVVGIWLSAVSANGFHLNFALAIPFVTFGLLLIQDNSFLILF